MRFSPPRSSLLIPSLMALLLAQGARRVVAAQAPLQTVAAAPAPPRALDLQDYYRIETATGPAISPDGRRVAFVRTYLVESENRRQSEVWLAPADGSSPPVRISNPAYGASDPRWSPDCTLLAFTSRRRSLAARDSGSEESAI